MGSFFIALIPPKLDNIFYCLCNMPQSLKAGQRFQFLANIKYQETFRDSFIIDYAGQAVELTKVTLK